MDYTTKSYGRNEEVTRIYQRLATGADLSMPGPRRLGKSFLLDRIVEAGPKEGWIAIKIEVAGCQSVEEFFRLLNAKIAGHRSPLQTTISIIIQRFSQMIAPNTEGAGPWYQSLLSLDQEHLFERVLQAINKDAGDRWVLLIDELPIFLKALHDKGQSGVTEARNFMNKLNRLRADNNRVRWFITGSIGLEPLARDGNYMGAIVKYETFTLRPLNIDQACNYVMDLAANGNLIGRSEITRAEASAIANATGWLAPYYLHAVALKLDGKPAEDEETAQANVEEAIKRLLSPDESQTFKIWEEHLVKHYPLEHRKIAIAILSSIATRPSGAHFDTVIAAVGDEAKTKNKLKNILQRLDADGFVNIDDWESDNPKVSFRNVLLRRWWQRFPVNDNN